MPLAAAGIIAGRFVLGAVSGGVGGYLSSGGCVEGAIIGAIAGGAASILLPNPTVASRAGTVADGFFGSSAGQFAAGAAGISNGTNNRLVNSEGNFLARGISSVDLGLALASGLGAGFSSALYRDIFYRGLNGVRGMTVKGAIGSSVVEGIGAGAAELTYSGASRLIPSQEDPK